MSKKKNKNRKNIDNYRSHSFWPWLGQLNFIKQVKEETKYGIWAIISFVFALFFILSSFSQAGITGRFFYDIFTYLLGVGYFLLPVAFILLGTSFIRSKSSDVSESSKSSQNSRVGLRHTLGTILFLVSGLGLVEIFFPSGLSAQAGGVLGLAISKLFLSLFDIYVSVIFFSAFFIISLLVIFDKRPNLTTWFKKIILNPLSLIFNRKRKTEYEYNESELSAKKDMEEVTFNGNESETKEEEKVEEVASIKEEKEGGSSKSDLSKHAKRGQTLHPAELGSVPYIPPPLSLLERDSGKPNVGDIKSNLNIIKRTLQNFGIEVEMDEVTIGPTVTRYALRPAEGMKLSRIIGLKNDLSLALAAYPLRIEAPIPGKSLVGIEVPNRSKSTVGLASLLSDTNFTNAAKPLYVALGKNIAGRPTFGDIDKMPHMLVSGTTGSGKSVLIHTIITSLLYKNGPADLRFIMIDPKRVELTLYNGIPHLLTPTITDPKKAILALKWAAKEMERRYNILEAEKVRDIQSYHQKVSGIGYPVSHIKNEDTKYKIQNTQYNPMPYIVIVIDELADIMSIYPRELESGIVRLAQMARAVGIHLIISTQRPSVNVITGLIKANIPTRVALQVASQIDSRTILDCAGAETLLGAGDMLYLSGEMAQPERLQSAYISEDEVKKVVKFITKNNKPVDEVPPEIEMTITNPNLTSDPNLRMHPNLQMISDSNLQINLDEEDNDNDDELYENARMAVIEAGKASTSYLQRKLKLGYSRAARLMDMLEERGVIGASDGARPREVLINQQPTTNNQQPTTDDQQLDN